MQVEQYAQRPRDLKNKNYWSWVNTLFGNVESEQDKARLHAQQKISLQLDEKQVKF